MLFDSLQKDHQLIAWQWLISSGVSCFVVHNFRKGLEAFWNRKFLPEKEESGKKPAENEKNGDFLNQVLDEKNAKNE
jgi:hypothetical protein